LDWRVLTVEDLADDAVLRAPMEAAGYVLRVLESDHQMLRTPDSVSSASRTG
jgi:hypothetical protein